MNGSRSRNFRLFPLLSVVLLAFTLVGCDDGKNGADGANGAAGVAGVDGADGVSCWDLNANNVADPEEDLNDDGVVDTFDCNPLSGGAYEAEQLHKGYFTDHDYEGTKSCLNCHGLIGDEMLTNAHFSWEGIASNIEGYDTSTLRMILRTR